MSHLDLNFICFNNCVVADCPGFKLASHTGTFSESQFPLSGRDYSKTSNKPFIVPCNHEPCCDVWAPQKYRLIEALTTGQISELLYTQLSPLHTNPADFVPITTNKPNWCPGFKVKEFEVPVPGEHYEPDSKLPIVLECKHESFDDLCDPYAPNKYLLINAYANGGLNEKTLEYLLPDNFEPWSNLTFDEWQEMYEMDEDANVRLEVESQKQKVHSWTSFVPGKGKYIYLTRKNMYLCFKVEETSNLMVDLCKILQDAGESVSEIVERIDFLYDK